MAVEPIGEKAYSEAVIRAQGIWLLMEGQSAYVLSDESGQTLVTWSTLDEANEFAAHIESRNLSPVFFPLHSLFAGIIEQPAYNIIAIAASPRFGFPALTYDKNEYVA